MVVTSAAISRASCLSGLGSAPRPLNKLGSDFEHRHDSDLSNLSDEELLAYIRSASDAGEPAEAKRALSTLVCRYAPDVTRRVSMKVPAADVQDVAQNVLMSAITSAFNGQSKGEFHSWLNRITARRIADYYRDKQRRPDEVWLPDEHEGDEDFWGESLAGLEPDAAEVETRDLVSGVIREFNEGHQAVIIKFCFQHGPAAEVADEINELLGDRLDTPMTANNVQQIGSRFRKRLRQVLDEDDNSG